MRSLKIILCVAIILIATGCQPVSAPGEPEPTEPEGIINLTELLPDEVGYTWWYAGFAEYGHHMKLDEIDRDEETGVVVYHILGEVDDVSGEGNPDEYRIDLDYVIQNGQLKQLRGGKRMMDDDYREIILLQEPFTVGESWTQIVYAEEGGDPQTLKCTLIGINLVHDQIELTMEYRQGANYEVRTFTEGKGITTYMRTLPIGDKGELVEVGYMVFDWK